MKGLAVLNQGNGRGAPAITYLTNKQSNHNTGKAWWLNMLAEAGAANLAGVTDAKINTYFWGGLGTQTAIDETRAQLQIMEDSLEFDETITDQITNNA